jgi:glutamyl-tRNA reductase
MRVGVIGINYKSSKLNIREVLAKTAHAQMPTAIDTSAGFSYVLLVTCNRTEIYFSSDDLSATHCELLKVLRKDIDIPFEHFLYSYFGAECFMHLAKVTAGVDSVIFGESEIQRQVKKAYEVACTSQKLPSCMHYMFQKALKIAKAVRSQFPMAMQGATLEAVVMDLYHAFFSKVVSTSVLFIGNSEINRKMITHMKAKGVDHICLATRAPQVAEAFCQKYQLRLLPWEHLSLWPQFHMVVCGTNQKDYLIHKRQALYFDEPARVIPTSLIIDLSMPRSVEPSLGLHPQISLFNIEEMNALITQKQKIKRQDASAIDTMILDMSKRYHASFALKQHRMSPCAISS